MTDGLLLGELSSTIAPFLARQEWARRSLGADAENGVSADVVAFEVLRAGRPGMASVLVEATAALRRRLHVLVGWREVTQATEVLGRASALIGTAQDDGVPVLCYDALADQELCLSLLGSATGGLESAGRARVVQSLVSHASIVYDERLFMKCYRVIEEGSRPEIEMTAALDRVGFNHLLAPVARWSRPEGDLAVIREYLPGALEAKALCLTSLRDLLGRAVPDDAGPSFEEVGLQGGDVSAEMRRLGTTTAELHLALGEAFGVRGAPPAAEIRLHGDYHLRRAMRADSGWLVAGFGDDPLTGAEAGASSQQAARFGNPLEDVAELFASMAQVAIEAVSSQAPATLAHARVLTVGWVRHNRAAFLQGYLSAPGIEALVPAETDEVNDFITAALRRRLAVSTGSRPEQRSSRPPPSNPPPLSPEPRH